MRSAVTVVLPGNDWASFESGAELGPLIIPIHQALVQFGVHPREYIQPSKCDRTVDNRLVVDQALLLDDALCQICIRDYEVSVLASSQMLEGIDSAKSTEH